MNTITMNKKKYYEAPKTESVIILLEQTILENSISTNRQSYGEATEETWGA